MIFLIHSRLKSNDGRKYAVSLSLIKPKSDLLTFGIFARNYQKDIYINGTEIYRET